MSEPLVVLREQTLNGGPVSVAVWMWCPACDELHHVGVPSPGHEPVSGMTLWEWNGDPEKPTISPSILVSGVQWPDEYPDYVKRSHDVPPGALTKCHSFVRDGHWQYLPDCTHNLAGQTVPMVPLPEDARP